MKATREPQPTDGFTLRSLQLTEPTDSVDLYDRMGQVARRGGRRAYSEA